MRGAEPAPVLLASNFGKSAAQQRPIERQFENKDHFAGRIRVSQGQLFLMSTTIAGADALGLFAAWMGIGGAQTSNRTISPEARIFAENRDAVLTIRANGKGSGFLISETGLILTNYHVVGSDPAPRGVLRTQTVHHLRVVALDKQEDLAVLQINPSLVKGIRPLALASPTDAPPFEGERILVIGSPLHQERIMTTGIVSKVEEAAILSDVNANPGNSGGPVMNMDGRVIGVLTFADAGRGTPGVSGIVRIERALHVVRQALVQAADASLWPSDRALPQPSRVLITDGELAAGSKLVRRPEVPFLKAPRNFRTLLNTPFIQRRAEEEELKRAEAEWRRTVGRRYKNSPPPALESRRRFFWERYVGDRNEAVVTLEIIPWPQETSGSQWGRALGSIFGVATRRVYEFRDDVGKVEILRGGEVVEVYDVRRLKHDEFVDSQFYRLRDIAFGSLITLDPIVFRPGAPIRIRVWKNDQPKPTEFEVPRGIQEAIWKPFEPWHRRASTG